MTTRKPPTIAVLWGDQARAMSWVRLDDGRTDSIAHADPNGFWMRNTSDRDIAEAVYRAWQYIQDPTADHILAGHATHTLDTTHYPTRCVPIHEETLL